MKIGNVSLKNEYILAPMAGVTDLPFRLICGEMGAGLVCMEMVSAKALTFKNKKTFDMLRTLPGEGVISCQLFGSEPEIMAEAVKMIEEYPFPIIDVNMGCPVPKVVNNGEGSALMKNPLLASRIVEAMVKATSKPVTVKIRAGFAKDNKNAVEMAHVLEESGAAAVAVHGRTREEYYSGTADWDIIAQVKDKVSIPVIGNGDVVDFTSAMRMKEQTGVDGIMVGRGARGNPWIFKSLNDGVDYEKPTVAELKQMIARHATLLTEEKGEYIAIREMRQHIAWYTTGYYNSTTLRRKINEIGRLDEMIEALECLNLDIT